MWGKSVLKIMLHLQFLDACGNFYKVYGPAQQKYMIYALQV